MIITVVGLGVVGGSFVKALKGQGHEVYGVDVDEEVTSIGGIAHHVEGPILEDSSTISLHVEAAV